MNPAGNEEYYNSWQNTPQRQYNLWQDSQYLDYNTPGNIFTQIGHDSYFTATSYNIQKDEKNRRIVTRQMLYGSLENYNFESIESVKSDWKPVNFYRSTGSTYAPTIAPPPTRCLKKNNIEKKFDEAMAQTVKMSKAELMMQKMGWQGGALGKEGCGITAPIVPNAAYATTTLGLGNSMQYTPRPSAFSAKAKKQAAVKSNRKSKQPLENKDVFLKNVLKTILDFLKNDFELELAFEMTLFNKERKEIHEIVQRFSEDDLEKYNFDTVEQMDLFAEIERCNMFVLATQSEGTYPDRKLCLYKEAPANMYLVTPYDLKVEDEENVETVNETDNAQSINPTKLVGDEIPEAKRVNVGKAIGDDQSDVNQMADENFYNIEQKKDTIASGQTIDESKDVNDSNSLDTDESNPFLLSITKNLRTPKSDTDHKSALKDNSSDEKSQSKTNEDNTKIALDKKTNDPMRDDVKMETAAAMTETDEIRQMIVDFFVEFCEDEKYDEFRFVGPFSEEELDTIYKFFKDVDTISSNPTASEHMKGSDKIAQCCAKICLEIKQDYNGHSAIYKKHE